MDYKHKIFAEVAAKKYTVIQGNMKKYTDENFERDRKTETKRYNNKERETKVYTCCVFQPVMLNVL